MIREDVLTRRAGLTRNRNKAVTLPGTAVYRFSAEKAEWVK
jgi:hypothetical protein